MTMLLLTAEAGAVFGMAVWFLLRLWTRSREISLADVRLQDCLAVNGQIMAGSSQVRSVGSTSGLNSINSGVDGPGLTGKVTGNDGLATICVPRSPSAGPYVVAGGEVRGFARSPLGAVVAAINIALPSVGVEVLTGSRRWSADRRRKVLGAHAAALPERDISPETGVVAPGPPREGGGNPVPSPRSGETRQPTAPHRYRIETIGWEIEHYSSRTAAVRYVLTRSGGGGGVVATTMRVEVNWVDDDWQVVVPPAGDWAEAFSADVDASGFIAFPAAV